MSPSSTEGKSLCVGHERITQFLLRLKHDGTHMGGMGSHVGNEGEEPIKWRLASISNTFPYWHLAQYHLNTPILKHSLTSVRQVRMGKIRKKIKPQLKILRTDLVGIGIKLNECQVYTCRYSHFPFYGLLIGSVSSDMGQKNCKHNFFFKF